MTRYRQRLARLEARQQAHDDGRDYAARRAVLLAQVMAKLRGEPITLVEPQKLTRAQAAALAAHRAALLERIASRQ